MPTSRKLSANTSKKSKAVKKKSELPVILLTVAIILGLVTIWYATDPMWPLITLAVTIIALICLKKGW